MTCIVGCVDQGELWIGADSFVGGDDLGVSRTNPKVFRHGELLLGYCGQSRAAQIIQHCAEFPEWPDGLDAFAFLIARWIPVIRASLEQNGRNRQSDSADEMSSAFLIGARGRLFFMGGDFALDEYASYVAAGSGESVAIGALSVVSQSHIRNRMEWSPVQVLTYALEAASLHVPTVAQPFYIEKL